MDKRPAQFLGVIYWLIPHKPGKKRFQPNINFTAIARFTSNLSGPVLEADVNYSPFPIFEDTLFRVRLHFRTLVGKNDEIKKLTRYTEILIMDGHKVIAICRDITVPLDSIYIDDEWDLEIKDEPN